MTNSANDTSRGSSSSDCRPWIRSCEAATPRVHPDAWVGAGALVTPGTEIPTWTLALGVPARVVRELSDEEKRIQRAQTLSYVDTARRHAASSSWEPAR